MPLRFKGGAVKVERVLKRPWIPSVKRLECLSLFEKGYGYKRAAKETGLNVYTVREYRRRYNSGDTAWAYRFSDRQE